MTAAQIQKFMPSTTVITSSADWLRDEGENIAQQLQVASVSCGVIRLVGSLHDAEIFVGARTSPTVELVMLMLAGKLREVLIDANEVMESLEAQEVTRISKRKRQY